MARIPAKNNVTSRNTVVNYVASLTAKYANSAATHIEVPHSDKPTSAGDEHVKLKGPDQEGQLLGQLSKEQQKPPVNETLRKLAVVLSQVVQQGIADQEAAAQGQEAAPVPQNVNMSQTGPQPSATPLPMGMQQAQAPAQPQQPQAGAAPVAAAPAQKAANSALMQGANYAHMFGGNAQAAQTRLNELNQQGFFSNKPNGAAAPTAPAVGSKPGIKPIKPMAAKGTNPMFNPIQSFGGLSATGDINGNAGLGVKNSPDSLKSASFFSSLLGRGANTAAQAATTAATTAAKAAPRLDITAVHPSAAAALAHSRGESLTKYPDVLAATFGYKRPPARDPMSRVMAARSDAGGIRRFGDSISSMGPDQKTRMSAAWDRWQNAANTQARANGTSINRASNPIEADAFWGNLGIKQSASKACSCGCGDTVKTCKCGPSCKCRKPGGSCYKPAEEKSAALGLWDRIRMKKERGGKPAKPGDKDYPDSKSWKKVTAISEKAAKLAPDDAEDMRALKQRQEAYKKAPAWKKVVFGRDLLSKTPYLEGSANDEKKAGSPAWQRSAGKNEEGGLNEKGRKSYEREHGGNLKAPVTEKNPKGKAKKRQHSFCSRMCGMKRVNTGASTAKDPDSRINKSLRKWNCKCSSAAQFGVKIAYLLGNLR